MRLRPDFSAVAARTHVSDSAVPWHRPSSSYNQVCRHTRHPGLEVAEAKHFGFLDSHDILSCMTKLASKRG